MIRHERTRNQSRTHRSRTRRRRLGHRPRLPASTANTKSPRAASMARATVVNRSSPTTSSNTKTPNSPSSKPMPRANPSPPASFSPASSPSSPPSPPNPNRHPKNNISNSLVTPTFMTPDKILPQIRPVFTLHLSGSPRGQTFLQFGFKRRFRQPPLLLSQQRPDVLTGTAIAPLSHLAFDRILHGIENQSVVDAVMPSTRRPVYQTVQRYSPHHSRPASK